MTGRHAYEDPAVLARVAAILLNARRADAANVDPSDHEPGTARTHKGSDRPEAGRAA